MILVIDNYDSFTYNLVHLVAGSDRDVRVVRNDMLSVRDVRALDPDGILVSPGPGRPADAGITEAVIRERLEVYKNQTLPVVEAYRGRDLLHEIDASGDPATVFERLRKAVKPS